MRLRVLLGWAALPITDRRWAAPLSAVALGFGLFVGVAIGPGAAGTFATGAAQVIEIPLLGGGEEDESATAAVAAPHEGSGDKGEGGGAPSPAPAFTASEEAPVPVEPEPEPPAEEPAPPADEAEPEEPVVTGIVIHLNPTAGSYTLAEAGGALDVVHASKLPRAATRLSLPVRSVADGTLAEAGTRSRLGTRSRTMIEGTVTYVDPTPAAPAYAVSRRGVSVLVHVRPDPTGALPMLPPVGSLAQVAVGIERQVTSSPSEAIEPPTEAPAVPTETAETVPEQPPPSCAPDPAQLIEPAPRPRAVLWQRQLSLNGDPLTFGEFAGIVTAVCPDEGRLRISADDIRESGADLLVSLSTPDIDLTRVHVGDSVLATAEIAADGSLSLTGIEPVFSQSVHRAFTTP